MGSKSQIACYAGFSFWIIGKPGRGLCDAEHLPLHVSTASVSILCKSPF